MSPDPPGSISFLPIAPVKLLLHVNALEGLAERFIHVSAAFVYIEVVTIFTVALELIQCFLYKTTLFEAMQLRHDNCQNGGRESREMVSILKIERPVLLDLEDRHVVSVLRQDELGVVALDVFNIFV